MANDLHMTGVQTFWIVTSYLLTATVFQPTFTSISHVLGIKPILLLAITAFSAGSIICALASNLAALLVGRSFEGIGAAGVTALTHLIIFDTVSPGEQDRWSNAVTLQWILATMVGPIFGGLLAEKASWHSIFWYLQPSLGKCDICADYRAGSCFPFQLSASSLSYGSWKPNHQKA